MSGLEERWGMYLRQTVSTARLSELEGDKLGRAIGGEEVGCLGPDDNGIGSKVYREFMCRSNVYEGALRLDFSILTLL